MKVDIDCKMGVRLREKREFLGISLEEVAAKVDITPGYLGLVERGRRSLTLEELGLLMEILEMKWDDLTDKEELLLEQEIRNSIELLNKNDLRIVLTVCNLLTSSTEKYQIPKTAYFIIPQS